MHFNITIDFPLPPPVPIRLQMEVLDIFFLILIHLFSLVFSSRLCYVKSMPIQFPPPPCVSIAVFVCMWVCEYVSILFQHAINFRLCLRICLSTAHGNSSANIFLVSSLALEIETRSTCVQFWFDALPLPLCLSTLLYGFNCQVSGRQVRFF